MFPAASWRRSGGGEKAEFTTVSLSRPLAPRWVKMRPERRQLAPMNSVFEAEPQSHGVCLNGISGLSLYYSDNERFIVLCDPHGSIVN
jgi:hypothetical protein